MEPLGSNRLVPFDARIIAATSRDLVKLVQSGQFREDLFYRLNVLPLRVPPLRERSSDIPALIEVLAEDLALRSDLPHPEFSPQAVALLSAQNWRGNVRELRNVLEQLLLRSDTGVMDAPEVEQVLRESGLGQISPLPVSASFARHSLLPLVSQDADAFLAPLSQQVEALERLAVAKALEVTQGNKVAAAKMLGVSRAKLYLRLP
jgi:DNA-binding NtrC family response regulator